MGNASHRVKASLLDRIACSAFRREPKFFREGRGDPATYVRLVEIFESYDPAKPIEVRWVTRSERSGVRVREGWFRTPGARALPIESRKAWIQMIEPQRGRAPARETPVCIHFPATGDQGF